jgi:hypothetical protein
MLTAGCPFAHDLPGGIRGCLEECMTLLAEHQAPPPVDEIRVGGNLALRPRIPRPRREVTAKPRLFDAAEDFYSDSRLADVSQWRITSILEALRRFVTWVDVKDSAERSSRLEEIKREVERRGLDFSRIIRYGLGSEIAMTIMTNATLSQVIGEINGIGESVNPAFMRIRAWVPVLGLENLEPVRSDDIAQIIIDAFELDLLLKVMGWVHGAPLEDIMDLIPPSDLDRYVWHEDDIECEWLVDRFTQTYLWRWKLSSLKLEWKYQHGMLAPPCGDSDMTARSVKEEDLANQISALTIDEDDRAASKHSRAYDFVSIAANLLNAGRRKEAAAIFEAVSTLSPRDPLALNNWAFCMILDSPDAALDLLDRAAQMGQANSLIVMANRLFCLLRINRHSTALAVADKVISTLNGRNAEGAYLWSPDSFSLEWVPDLRIYIIDIIERIVLHSSDDGLVEQWRPLLEEARTTICLE